MFSTVCNKRFRSWINLANCRWLSWSVAVSFFITKRSGANPRLFRCSRPRPTVFDVPNNSAVIPQDRLRFLDTIYLRNVAIRNTVFVVANGFFVQRHATSQPVEHLSPLLFIQFYLWFFHSHSFASIRGLFYRLSVSFSDLSTDDESSCAGLPMSGNFSSKHWKASCRWARVWLILLHE